MIDLDGLIGESQWFRWREFLWLPKYAFYCYPTPTQHSNIIKLVEDEGYSSPKILFGVVTDILNNGEKTFVELVTLNKQYSTSTLEYKLLSGDKSAVIFPATQEDLLAHFEE